MFYYIYRSNNIFHVTLAAADAASGVAVAAVVWVCLGIFDPSKHGATDKNSEVLQIVLRYGFSFSFNFKLWVVVSMLHYKRYNAFQFIT